MHLRRLALTLMLALPAVAPAATDSAPGQGPWMTPSRQSMSYMYYLFAQMARHWQPACAAAGRPEAAAIESARRAMIDRHPDIYREGRDFVRANYTAGSVEDFDARVLTEEEQEWSGLEPESVGIRCERAAAELGELADTIEDRLREAEAQAPSAGQGEAPAE